MVNFFKSDKKKKKKKRIFKLPNFEHDQCWVVTLFEGLKAPLSVSTRENQIETGVLEPIPKLELECIYLKNWTQNQILSSIYVWNQNSNPEF
jgi:hypothetical protein